LKTEDCSKCCGLGKGAEYCIGGGISGIVVLLLVVEVAVKKYAVV
jgi:hypothetical protein